MVYYIGKGIGFSQRHYTQTESYYCPQEALKHTEQLHRSEVTLSSVRNDILNFGCDASRPTDPLFDQVVKEAAQVWRFKEQVQPIHLNDLPSYVLDTDSSSPGLPWKTLGYTTKRQVMDDQVAFKSVRSFWHNVKYGNKQHSPPDCAAYLRAHLATQGEDKVRAIWGYPATIGFQEACFALPLIREYAKGGYPIAYGYETACGGHLRILNRFGMFGHFLSSDFKSFDKTIPAWLIRIAFDILLLNIDFGRYADHGFPKPYNLYRAWKYLVEYFIHTPIRMSNGERYRKSNGVASGSYFTQMIDSIVNWIVTVYALRKAGNIVEDILVLGDDSLVKTTYPVNLETFASHAEICGMVLNLEKSAVDERLSNVKFLGFYIRNGVPFKPVEELWAALRFPETPDYSYDEYATRASGLLYASFGQHPDFYRHVVASISIPFELILKPSMRRFLQSIGFTQHPGRPPPNYQLAFAAFRDRKV